MNFKELVRKKCDKKTFIELEKYVEMIEEKNKVMNLTGFKGDKLWELGIYESIVSLEAVFGSQKGKLLDIGAGAGFPSIPYAIFNKGIDLTIHEPLLKRVKFLKSVINELDLKVVVSQVKTQNSDKDNNCYDFVTARAVMPLSSLISISYPKGKKGSTFAFIKGPKVYEEIKDSKSLVDKYNLKILVTSVKTNNNKKTLIASFLK